MESRIRELIEQGREAFESRDYVAALGAFREVLTLRPEFADIRHLAGLCLSLLGRHEDALEEFDRALAVNDGYVEAHVNRALTLNELGRFDEARQSFERAGYYEYAVSGRFPAGITARLANGHAMVGDLYLEAAAPSEAAAQYNRALELRPRYHDIRNKLAQALLQLGDLEAAAQQLDRVLEGNPHFVPARLNLGLVYWRRGEVEKASHEWERCREQDPNNPQVRAYLSMLESRRTDAPHA